LSSQRLRCTSGRFAREVGYQPRASAITLGRGLQDKGRGCDKGSIIGSQGVPGRSKVPSVAPGFNKLRVPPRLSRQRSTLHVDVKSPCRTRVFPFSIGDYRHWLRAWLSEQSTETRSGEVRAVRKGQRSASFVESVESGSAWRELAGRLSWAASVPIAY
jgi:hypothetical protein